MIKLLNNSQNLNYQKKKNKLTQKNRAIQNYHKPTKTPAKENKIRLNYESKRRVPRPRLMADDSSCATREINRPLDREGTSPSRPFAP